MRNLLSATIATALVLTSALSAAAEWDPAGFAAQDVLEFRTTEAGEDEHWSPVWLVILDDSVYIRLGDRAANRIRSNITSPNVAVRIAGEEFPAVRAEPAPQMAERVAEAMADKYWSDLFVRYFAHPLTMRLTPSP